MPTTAHGTVMHQMTATTVYTGSTPKAIAMGVTQPIHQLVLIAMGMPMVRAMGITVNSATTPCMIPT